MRATFPISTPQIGSARALRARDKNLAPRVADRATECRLRHFPFPISHSAIGHRPSAIGYLHVAASLLVFLAVAFPAGAGTASPALEPIQTPSLFFSALRVTGALTVVVACFLGGVWLWRNWQRFAVRGGRIPKLHVLESKPLGPRTGLYVIGYEQQRFLIASAPTGISMLTPLPPGSPEEVAAPAPVPQLDFASILSRALAFRGKPGASQV